MKRIFRLCLGIVVALLATGCNGTDNKKNYDKHRSVYYWRSTFDIDPNEQEFLQKHNIDRLYLKMYDVAVEYNFSTETEDIVPIATTQFASTIPSGMDIVPVVYITIEALRAMEGKEAEFAELIVERTVAMCNYNKCGTIQELQLDCDWTAQTRNCYHTLCQLVRERLQAKSMELSITVRLHQLQETPPPADKGVLMLYNTGDLTNITTRNSILDIENVKPYIKEMEYPLPLDYAYPAFGWGVKFYSCWFQGIVAEDAEPEYEGEHIRRERATADEILAVKRFVEKNLGKPASGSILYHLDKEQLKNYTDDEIAQILAY